MTAASIEGKGTKTATADGRTARNTRAESPAVRRRRHAPAIIAAVGMLVLWHLIVVVFDVCGFQSIPITHSSRFRSLIPFHSDHLFQSQPITDSSAIPITFGVGTGTVGGV